MSQKLSKINVKERFSDGEIDLSMSNLDEVPVKEIAALKKTVSLDLSNNSLSALPSDFSSLAFLTKLDLSKNELIELPEDFGSLNKLRHLDLYRNQLERLPLSFGQLTKLKFLDLKDNPLVPTLAKVAGPCVDNKGCQQCAKDVVKFFKQLQEEMDTQVEIHQKAKQKELETTQQKKQKKLKKVKQTQNKLNSKARHSVDLASHNGTNTKKNFENDQKKRKTHETKTGVKFGKLTIYFVLLSMITLWFLFALRWQPMQKLVPNIHQFYESCLDKLSPSYQSYGRYFGDYVVSLQDKTRRMSLYGISMICNSEMYQRISTRAQSYLEFVFIKN